MSKQRDEAWAEEMRKRVLPAGYKMTLMEGWAMLDLGDPLHSVAAAYNYGFERGQNYERNRSRAKGRRPF